MNKITIKSQAKRLSQRMTLCSLNSLSVSPSLSLWLLRSLFPRDSYTRKAFITHKMSSSGAVKDAKVPLLQDLASTVRSEDDHQDQDLAQRILIESKKLKTGVIAWVYLAALVVHVLVSWLFVSRLQLGVVRTAITLNFSWWVLVFGLLGYTLLGGCPLTWTGFSIEAFCGLWEFVKLSAASGVMLCMTINEWESTIPLAFFAATGMVLRRWAF